ncbi:uncharacterized protein LOC131846426 isoform X2 [Achroia grisella]|uniref:uncharacterized protein LOC131846426 isoform X2 n=1 Tax=Achroia grisella TaxID=688607 RepID=UPI0027D2FFA8|nr:uncharacterized protein LOC131846426 isoform X2 [Achroia grisella]
MAESLFDIFGDHLTRQAMKNVSRQPLANIENMGKTVTTGPIKPNEPLKKGDIKPKKSFLSNAGKALQSSPTRRAFTPRAVNMGSLIYTDADTKTNENEWNSDELLFTKPSNKYVPEPPILKQFSPPSTPPPTTIQHSAEFDCSYEDEFFTDDFSNEGIPDEDLGLPDLY